MNFTDFLRELSSLVGTVNNKKFYINNKGKIRHLYIKDKNKRKRACPLNVLCNSNFLNSEIDEMAQHLGMTNELAECIAIASDYKSSSFRTDEFNYGLIRQAILAITGLNERGKKT